MSDRRDIADVLIRQKAILDTLTAANTTARRQVADGYRPGDADTTDLGRVRMDKPRRSTRVMDGAALLAWVREYRPDEIVTVEQIRPAFLKAITAAGSDGEWTDPITGEVHPIPGLAVVESPPSLVVTTTDTGKQWALDALHTHIPELPAP